MMKKKFLSLALVSAMVLSICSCNGSNNGGSSAPGSSTPNSTASSQDGSSAGGEVEPGEFAPVTYDQNVIYDNAFGEFYEVYQKAKAETDIPTRYAMMALAEGKWLASGASLPQTSQGGSYTMNKIVPYTISTVLWGNDSSRMHQALVTNEIIKTEDRDVMKEQFRELQGTGGYEEWVRGYLAEHEYTLKDNLNYIYSADNETWDVLSSSQAIDGEVLVHTFDGLMEYDIENVLQPALAESYDVSEDGLTYTFHLREGVSWVDSQGRKVADVKADDFVAGMEHLIDAGGGLEALLDGLILNASAYLNGEITDFSQVGVKALDDYTVEYTLEAPTSYFMTMLGYNIFAPMSRSYYESQGGKFGADYAPEDTDYNYGKSPDTIAYCGPYLVTNSTAKNSIVFQANPQYWNADGINLKSMTWFYQEGTDATKMYNDFKDGTTDSAGILNPSALEVAKQDGLFDEYGFVSATDATSFFATFNLNRQSFANYNDPTKLVSPQTHGSADEINLDEGVYTSEILDDAARTHAAVNNRHFRLAFNFAVDRAQYNAQRRSDDLKYTNMRNTYVPGNFVFLETDVTVDVNGKSTTFPAGTNYGEIVQAQLDADGVPVTVWDPSTGADDPSTGFDGWYNVENAKAEMAKAVEELAAIGVEVSKENPIQLDVMYAGNVEYMLNEANVLKQCMDSAFDGLIQMNLIPAADLDEYRRSGYNPELGSDMNFDWASISGWSPDWGDPNSYLDQILPEDMGYMSIAYGLW